MKGVFKLLPLLIITLGLAAGYYLMSQRQDRRSSAAVESPTLLLLPSVVSANDVGVGETFAIRVRLDSGTYELEEYDLKFAFNAAALTFVGFEPPTESDSNVFHMPGTGRGIENFDSTRATEFIYETDSDQQGWVRIKDGQSIGTTGLSYLQKLVFRVEQLADSDLTLMGSTNECGGVIQVISASYATLNTCANYPDSDKFLITSSGGADPTVTLPPLPTATPPLGNISVTGRVQDSCFPGAASADLALAYNNNAYNHMNVAALVNDNAVAGFSRSFLMTGLKESLAGYNVQLMFDAAHNLDYNVYVDMATNSNSHPSTSTVQSHIVNFSTPASGYVDIYFYCNNATPTNVPSTPLQISLAKDPYVAGSGATSLTIYSDEGYWIVIGGSAWESDASKYMISNQIGNIGTSEYAFSIAATFQQGKIFVPPFTGQYAYESRVLKLKLSNPALQMEWSNPVNLIRRSPGTGPLRMSVGATVTSPHACQSMTVPGETGTRCVPVYRKSVDSYTIKVDVGGSSATAGTKFWVRNSLAANNQRAIVAKDWLNCGQSENEVGAGGLVTLTAALANCPDLGIYKWQIKPKQDSENYAWSNDLYIKVLASGDTSVGGVGATSPPSTDGTLPFKFKVSFNNVYPEAACASDMRVNLVVKAAEGDKTFTNVAMTKTTEKIPAGFAVYRGEVRLSGVAAQNNVYVLISGPKQITTKFSTDNQETYYNVSGGILTLGTDENKVWNFSKLPILSGDVVNANSQTTPDGKVDGADYTYVKREFVKDDPNTLADLDYDCKVSGTDMNVVQVSLNEKYSQLY